MYGGYTKDWFYNMDTKTHKMEISENFNSTASKYKSNQHELDFRQASIDRKVDMTMI